MSFAENLRAIMKREGISQSDLARRLGIRSQAVNQWLQPEGTAPRGARLVAVAAALGVELSELLAEASEKLPSSDQTRAELFAAIDAMNEEHSSSSVIGSSRRSTPSSQPAAYHL